MASYLKKVESTAKPNGHLPSCLNDLKPEFRTLYASLMTNSYLLKIESAVWKKEDKPKKKDRPGVFKPTKPVKPTKPQKNSSPTKPVKPTKFKKTKPEKVTATGGKIKKKSQMTFTRTRMLIPEIQKFLAQTDPLKMGGDSWNEFFAQMAPKIMAYLLWDMGELEQKEIRSVWRYLAKRVKRTSVQK